MAIEVTVQRYGPDAVILSLLAGVAIAWLTTGVRHRFSGWRWWQIVCFLAGCAGVAAAVGAPLDSLGRRDLLTAHVGQHIILGDGAAPLLLLGLPPQARHWLRTRLVRLRQRTGRPSRLLGGLLSPLGALIAWTVASYAWYAPAVHRLAVPAGPVHVGDHLSFLAFGLLIWLGAFDPREPASMRAGLRDGGLPWWGRHGYAMFSRVAMVPPAAALWLAAGYHTVGQLPLGYTRHEDQVNAASLLIGFEMLLFAFAFVLAFIVLAVAEGHRQAAEDALRHRTAGGPPQ